jgi:hypothetical protein
MNWASVGVAHALELFMGLFVSPPDRDSDFIRLEDAVHGGKCGLRTGASITVGSHTLI